MKGKIGNFRLLNHKKEKYGEIFRENYKSLYTYAGKFVKDQHALADIVQEVFIRIWEKSVDLSKVNNLKSYLFSCVRNECINYLRHLKVVEEYRKREIENARKEIEYFANEKTVLEEERLEKLTLIIDRLPGIYRDVLILSRFKCYSNLQISKELGIPVRTVETRLYRGLKKVREEITPT